MIRDPDGRNRLVHARLLDMVDYQYLQDLGGRFQLETQLLPERDERRGMISGIALRGSTWQCSGGQWRGIPSPGRTR